MAKDVQIVDENDEPIGAASSQEARDKGMYHRIARVILKDENGRILSQRRSATKSLYANLWTDSASGHVDEGESYEVAIKRELMEETGIDANVTFLDKFLTRHINNGKETPVFNGIFEGSIPSSTEFVLDPVEVADIKWFELSDLKLLMSERPEDFTQGFIEVINRYY